MVVAEPSLSLLKPPLRVATPTQGCLLSGAPVRSGWRPDAAPRSHFADAAGGFDDTCGAFVRGGVATVLIAGSGLRSQRGGRRRPQPSCTALGIESGSRARHARVARLQGPSSPGGPGPVVDLAGATVRLGKDEILLNADLQVPRGARAVLVGPNGCGKTTLLSVIAGKYGLELGELAINTKSMGWLKQEAVSGSTKTIYQEAASQMPATAAYEAVEVAEAALAAACGGSEKTVAEAQTAYDDAVAIFEGLGGYEAQQKAARVLMGLSFGKADFERPVSELSGGWQMRVALARALLQEPSLLLLDEPTNHMDMSAKRWLANYLADELSSSSTLLLVTHDRAFLEEIRCSIVVEIADKRILTYGCGTIKEWETERKNRTERLHREIEKIKKVMQVDKDWVKKWGSMASKATMAQSKLKRVEKMEAEIRALKADLRGMPTIGKDAAKSETADGTLPLSTPGKVNLRIPEAPLVLNPPTSRQLLTLKNVDVGYSPDAVVMNDVFLDVKIGQRVALLGPNGVGKTTLLRTLAGTLEAQAGTRVVGVGGLRKARVRLFTQDLAQDLPGDMTPVDYVLSDGAPADLDAQGARMALGSLGLRGEVHLSKISSLSGGEKARVALAVFTTRPADVLLLDEPTNHLDGAAVTSLSEGLRQHTSGAVLVASHDRAFVDALQVTHTANVERPATGKAVKINVKTGPPPPLSVAELTGAVAEVSSAPRAGSAAPTAGRRRRVRPSRRNKSAGRRETETI
eukprot:TRINITY_DN15602_c0_g2_i7.p1 TRINITY_DN15602_c0_g2~~TRINITY_DN15602_c0_g2_i7.p1  ORF type:complete len:746 (+),score=176.12 TRINITY_DN15602_c0_g2_i7:31-2268(+)